jgi:hypothetical protein
MPEEKNWTKCQNWNEPECPNRENPSMIMTYNIHPDKSNLTHIWKEVDKLCQDCPEFIQDPGYE